MFLHTANCKFIPVEKEIKAARGLDYSRITIAGVCPCNQRVHKLDDEALLCTAISQIIHVEKEI